jgi:hypothetical protein
VDLTVRFSIRNSHSSITSRSSGGPTYDKAYLSELKASTPGSRPSQVVNNDPYDADLSLDPYDLSTQSMEIGNVLPLFFKQTARLFTPVFVQMRV